jgi:hypothetical protein
MSDPLENVSANSGKVRNLWKRLQSDGQQGDNGPDTPLGQSVSGTGINLIAAAIAANADFSFADPAQAENNGAANRQGDGTVNTDSSEGGRPEGEGNPGAADFANGQGAVNSGAANAANPADDKQAANPFAPGDAGPAAPQQNAQTQDQDANHKAAPKHHGSSSAPGIIGLGPIGGEVGAAAAPSTATSAAGFPATVVVAEAVTDSSGQSTFFVGNSDAGQFVSIAGAAEASQTTTVDFTHVKVAAAQPHLKAVHTASSPDTGAGTHDSGTTVEKLHIESKGEGVIVSLGEALGTTKTDKGEVEYHAAKIESDGSEGAPLASINNVDNVAGTIGNDIISGNDHANKIIYTADDDAQHATHGGDGTGAGASYGFDIVSGGPNALDHSAHEKASDNHDTVDFSRVGSKEGVAEAASHGNKAVDVLSHDAKGVHVDLEKSITIETVNPHTGDAVQITGTLVSTTGGSERTDLALIVWAAPAKETSPGELVSTIENIIGSHGADTVSGNSRDNVYTVVGSGESGPSTFDGRGGSDTIDFSKLGLPNSGIQIHLADSSSNSGHGGSGADNSGSGTSSDSGSGVAVAIANGGTDAGPGTAIVVLTNVENIIGSKGNDIIEGNSADNILTGISGCDTFIFKSTILLDGLEYADFGDDEIRDYNHHGSGSSGHGSDHDSLWLNNSFFHFDNGWSTADKINYLFDKYVQEDNGAMVIRIDSHNSIRLDNMSVSDARLYFSDTFYFI